MQAMKVGEALLTNIDEVQDFIDHREPVYTFLYVCSPEFFVENGTRYYNVRVNMYRRNGDGNGRRLEAH